MSEYSPSQDFLDWFEAHILNSAYLLFDSSDYDVPTKYENELWRFYNYLRREKNVQTSMNLFKEEASFKYKNNYYIIYNVHDDSPSSLFSIYSPCPPENFVDLDKESYKTSRTTFVILINEEKLNLSTDMTKYTVKNIFPYLNSLPVDHELKSKWMNSSKNVTVFTCSEKQLRNWQGNHGGFFTKDSNGKFEAVCIGITDKRSINPLSNIFQEVTV